MSVVDVLEKFNNKHADVGEEDKTGLKRMIRGAINKAAGLLWSAGGSVDVTLGPNVNSSVPAAFTEMRSPSDSSLSDDLYLSFDNSDNILLSCEDPNVSPPKSSLTSKVKKATTSDKVNSVNEGSDRCSPKKSGMSKGGSVPKELCSPDISLICSELERLSLKKIISEVEKTITDDVKEEFDRLRDKMEEHDEKVEAELSRQRDEKGAQRELTEMNWSRKIRENQLHIEQDFNTNLETLLKKTCDENSLKKTGEVQVASSIKRDLIESIGKTQKCYNLKFDELIHLLQSSQSSVQGGSVTLFTEFHNDIDSLKRNNIMLSDIISKSRCGNVSQQDAVLCQQLYSSLCNIFDRIKLRNEEYESKKKLEDEAKIELKKIVEKSQDNSETQLKETGQTTENNDDIVEIETGGEIRSQTSEFSSRRSERLQYYNYVNEKLETAEESLQQFLNNNNYKDFRKDCQRAVNMPVNAISPTNSQHMQDKLDKLVDLLDGKNVKVMGRKFSASGHPHGIKYCEILLARKIVKAGEDVVSSHPETGHAIASIVVCLTMRYPVLAVYLHAYFFRVCPYLVPLDLQPEKDETDEEYNKRLGFNYSQGEREETDKYLKRMSGVAQLYGAILVANKRPSDRSLNAPFGVSELWMWIANFISLDPLSDISATLLLDILEVAGHFMLSKYQFHFQKLLYLICTDYLKKIDKVTTKGRGGPVERLKTFLEDVIMVNRISPPKGLLPPNFW